MMNKRIKPGMTLIETVLYFTLLSLVLGAIMTFAIQVINMNKKSDNLRETQANLEFITKSIINSVQTANAVDDANSIFGDDAGKLSLVVDDAGRSPTQYYLQDSDVYVKLGSAQPVKLNSDSIICSLLKFEKVALPKVPDQINVSAVFEAKNQDIANLVNVLPIHTSASLRI